MTRSPIFAHAADQYREMRREFDVVLEAAYAAAEEGTHGSLLNAAGRAAPVDAYSLLMGPWSRVLKYGSPELIEWFEMHGRPSVAEFEREWFHARQDPCPDFELVMPLYDVTDPEYIAVERRFREVSGRAAAYPMTTPDHQRQCQRCGYIGERAHEWCRDATYMCPACWNATRRPDDVHAEI